MSTVAPERVNVSRLLDDNLEAGRAAKPAIVGEHATLTYEELARLTARTASLLRGLGVGRPRDRPDNYA
jgi:acyl-coenzyme A synthetase/AMP-(fatty) acid ligase